MCFCTICNRELTDPIIMQFIAGLPEEGGTIDGAIITAWIAQRKADLFTPQNTNKNAKL